MANGGELTDPNVRVGRKVWSQLVGRWWESGWWEGVVPVGGKLCDRVVGRWLEGDSKVVGRWGTRNRLFNAMGRVDVAGACLKINK